MKVKELIRKLQRMDQDAIVGWQAHDQDDHEIDGWVRIVTDGSEKMCEAEGEKSIVVLQP